MRRTPCLVLGAVLATLSAPREGWALGARILHQNSEAVARGNAFTATADNPSAVYYNPAGITQSGAQGLEFSAYAVGMEVRYDSPDGLLHADSPDKIQGLAQIFCATTIKAANRLYFGFGAYTPYGLGSTWSDRSSLRTFGTESKLMFLTLSPVLAWKITDTLSIGAGPSVHVSHVDLRRGILVQGDQFQFDGDGQSMGFNVGILWQPHPMHSFGVRFSSSTDMEYKGRVEVHSQTPALFPSSKENARVELDLPANIVAGYSFRPTPAWNFEVNLDWTDWDRFNSITIEKKSGNQTEAFNWTSSFTLMVGATHYFRNGFSVSAGYTYAEDSTPDANFHPNIPDMDFHIGSLGLRYESERWIVGLTYQFAYGERDVFGSALSPSGASADGHYEFISHSISLGLGMKF